MKTDARDALHLASLLKLGEIVEVAVPSVDQEAARDLVRAREDVRVDLCGPGTGSQNSCSGRGSYITAGIRGPGRTRFGSAPNRSPRPGLQLAYDTA